MRDNTTTRRRIVQGIGTIGLVGLVGGTVSAQEGNETDGTATADEDTAAIRIVHAVADAPAVDVRLTTEGTDGMETGGMETGGMETDGTATATEAGDKTETDGATETTAADDEQASEISVSGLEFGGVTEYQQLDPGTYRLEIVATESGLLDQILDLFQGDDEEATVIFQETVTVEAETTYTAVAAGELAEGPAGGGTATAATETAGSDEGTETDGSESADTASLTIGASPGLQVEVLEDDLSAPGEGMARLRVFHAVPDAGTVRIAAGGGGESTVTGEERQATVTDGDTADGPTATDGGADMGTTLVDALSFGESATVEVEAGEYSLTVQPVSETNGETDGDAETATDGATQGQRQEGRTVAVTVEDGGVYSGFAVGYFDPETAADQPVDTGETDNGTDMATEADGETEMGNESAEQGDGERTQRVRNRDFELVTVQDAQDGERAAGGNRSLM